MNLFLKINFLIATSYIIFQVIGLFGRRFKMLRYAQGLLIIALILPVLMKELPREQVYAVEMTMFRPYSESESNLITKIEEKHLNTKLDEVAVAENSFSMPDAALPFQLWLIGFILILGKFLWNIAGLNKMLGRSLVLRKFGSVTVVLSNEISIPFSYKLFRTKWVALPYNLLEKKNDLILAMKHELQHHRQGDTTWSVAIELLICFFYANPFIYLWKKEINELQEFLCDKVLTDHEKLSAQEYGNCLVRVAETALVNRRMYAGTTCMTTVYKSPLIFKTFLMRRIEMITEKRSKNIFTGPLIGIAALTITITLAYSSEQVSRSNKINPGTVIVDETIQKITEAALKETMKELEAKEGFAIVADPNTGKILAVANVDTKNIKKGHWALSELIEPASFNKVLVAAYAIDQGATSPEEKHNCEKGNYKFGNRIYHDWKEGGWDSLSTTESVAISSDICGIKIGEKLGADKLELMLKDFGFGAGGSASSFPEAKAGEFPINDKIKNKHFVPSVASGFGFKTTALELLQAYGAIANGGNLMEAQSANTKDSKIVRRILSADAAKKVSKILEAVVTSGTAKGRGESNVYTTAGKTASAYTQSFQDWMNGKKNSDFAGFIGYAPATNPRIEVYVGIKDPNDKTGAHGSSHAAPLFKKIVEQVLSQMKVVPDRKSI